MVRRCRTYDLPTIEAIINEAAQVYRNHPRFFVYREGENKAFGVADDSAWVR